MPEIVAATYSRKEIEEFFASEIRRHGERSGPEYIFDWESPTLERVTGRGSAMVVGRTALLGQDRVAALIAAHDHEHVKGRSVEIVQMTSKRVKVRFVEPEEKGEEDAPEEGEDAAGQDAVR